MLKIQDIVTIQKTYNALNANESVLRKTSGYNYRQLYNKPSYSIHPSDYVPLNDFLEITREILPPQISLKKIEDKYIANLADENLKLFMGEPPSIFLDGVSVDNLDPLMKLGSDKIDRIELICNRYNCGELEFPGILAVFSKKQEIKNLELSSGKLRMQLDGYYASSTFSSPDYSIKIPGNLPDFRQLLYWNPNITITSDNKQLPEFYASDHSGNYIICIEGITSKGVPVSMRTVIKVK